MDNVLETNWQRLINKIDIYWSFTNRIYLFKRLKNWHSSHFALTVCCIIFFWNFIWINKYIYHVYSTSFEIRKQK